MEIFIPVSLGELYDKISILEIKFQFIENENQKVNIKNELNKLQLIADKYSIDNNIYLTLKNINLEIWHIEDKIREKERSKVFDSDFIKYAQTIYYKNDERAKVKREINEKYGSTIIEEKSYEKY